MSPGCTCASSKHQHTHTHTNKQDGQKHETLTHKHSVNMVMHILLILLSYLCLHPTAYGRRCVGEQVVGNVAAATQRRRPHRELRCGPAQVFKYLHNSAVPQRVDFPPRHVLHVLHQEQPTIRWIRNGRGSTLQTNSNCALYGKTFERPTEQPLNKNTYGGISHGT